MVRRLDPCTRPQVKIRGFRVEVTEVEEVIRQLGAEARVGGRCSGGCGDRRAGVPKRLEKRVNALGKT